MRRFQPDPNKFVALVDKRGAIVRFVSDAATQYLDSDFHLTEHPYIWTQATPGVFRITEETFP